MRIRLGIHVAREQQETGAAAETLSNFLSKNGVWRGGRGVSRGRLGLGGGVVVMGVGRG